MSETVETPAESEPTPIADEVAADEVAAEPAAAASDAPVEALPYPGTTNLSAKSKAVAERPFTDEQKEALGTDASNVVEYEKSIGVNRSGY